MKGATVTKQQARAQRRRPFRHFVEFIAIRLIGIAIQVLPMEMASNAMGWCWRLVAPHLERHPRALAHLALAYPLASGGERERIARDMWFNMGRVFAESFFINRILKTGRVANRSAEVIASIKSQQRGVVFVSLHMGNWELVITPAIDAGIKAAAVYQRVKNPWIEHYLVQSRRERYPRGLFAKGSDVGLKLIKIVRDGGAVALLADLRDRRGASVPFFGHPAPSTTFPALICRSTGAMLVAGRVVRTGPVRFAIDAEIIEMPRTKDREADILEGTRLIQEQFESWIRQHPDQWMWAHRRWQ